MSGGGGHKRLPAPGFSGATLAARGAIARGRAPLALCANSAYVIHASACAPNPAS
jgi:hypothetical protein